MRASRWTMSRAHADTAEKRLAVAEALIFKCNVLWAQLDALHHAYVLGGGVPTGRVRAAGLPVRGPRHEPGIRSRDRPRGAAGLGAPAFRSGARPLGAAGPRAGAVPLRHLGDDHRAAGRGRGWTSWSTALAEEFEAPRETISVDVRQMLQGLADQGFLAVDASRCLSRLPCADAPADPGPSRRWACWPS